MIFPTLNLRSTLDPEDALGRIDRAIDDRNYRLTAGISISNRFEDVQGALVVSQGHGKYLRVRHVVAASAPISPVIRQGCLEIIQGQLRDIDQLSQLISDLAEPQAMVIEQLKCQAGKYVDRVLAVAVCDPGIWDQDFDGRVSYTPFCDATRLAELSGVTVIDAFPARDLAVGGSGRRLESLPYWIMFGDRNPRVASQSRLLVSIEDRCRLYLLPASDGLDSEVPQIHLFESLGTGFLTELIQRRFPDLQVPTEWDRLYADGRQIPALRTRWESVDREFGNLPGFSSLNLPIREGSPPDFVEADRSMRLADVTEDYMRDNAVECGDILRTGIRWVVDQTLKQLPNVGMLKAGQIMVSCPATIQASCINQFTQLLSDTRVMTTRQAGIDGGELAPVVAALLGLFHIDQMPANLPWLTGADCQRILGRLTPGRPSNWRQLVRIMADFKPAPMKLKDAI